VGLPEQYEVRISGGGAKSPIWQQIIADVFGAPLVNVNTPEAGAFGAAVLASVGTGTHPDVATACASMIATEDTVTPGENQTAYAAAYPRYQALYPALKDI